jgi:hypothetical protein
MKTRFSVYSLLLATIVFAFSSCQKDTESADYSAETAAHSDDQNRFSGEVDAAANDVVYTLDVTSGFAGRGQEVQSLICDATVSVDTMSNPRTITITYNGTNCIGNRTRTGVVVVSMAQGVRWKNAGAQINVSFQNLRITRVSDNKSILINGAQTYTNVSGGLLINLPVLNSITHTITSSNMSVTFDNNSQRVWQVARQRVFSYSNGVAVTVTGLHTENGVSGVAEWGTNRFGNSFTSAITQPLVFRQDCSFRLGSGKVEHRTAYFNAAATFGLDASGNPTGCPGANSYYMKIVWTGPAGNTRSAILPY